MPSRQLFLIMRNTKITIRQYDDRIVFSPVPDCIKEALTIWEKDLNGMRPLEMFAVADTDDGEVCVTYPGFAGRIAEAAFKHGVQFDIVDKRKACIPAGFPAPKLDAMYGFRFSQEALITEALKKDCSGLIGAPTRYGKTTLMVNTLRAYPSLPAVVVAPGVDLVDQLYDDLRGARGIKGREIKKITGTTSKVPSTDGITVCTIDCLEHVDESLPRLLLVDEPHALVTDHRLGLLNKFTKARRLGFGATLKGRFDNRDALITGAFGPVLANRTYQEAVTEGAVCQLNVIFLKIELTPQYFFSRNKAYDSALFLSATMAKTVADICRNVIPKDLQTLIFIANKAQAELYLDAMGDEAELAMAMLFKNKKEREALVAKVKENDIKRCLCTNIFVQGVTFSDLAVLVNCNAGAKYTNTIQKPGRLAEIRPGKKCGVVIDFMFVPPEDYDRKDVKSDTWLMPSKDSAARKKVYKDMGYGIYEVDSVEEMKEVFDSMI